MEFEGDLVLLQHALSHVREGDLERRPVSHLKHHSRAWESAKKKSYVVSRFTITCTADQAQRG